MKKERTMIAVKPDGVQRGLVGEIISRFERAGMKLVGAKLTAPTREQVKKHYYSEAWLVSTGTNSIKGYKEKGIDIKLTPREVGLRTMNMLIEYLSDRPVMLMVWEGPNVVEIARKIVGKTSPELADIGSIRGDLSLESYALADGLERALYNLIHASGAPEEAEKEIKLWFKKNEVLDYDLFIEKLIHDKKWGKINKNK